MSTVGITAENGAPANGPKESDPSGDDKELTSKSAMPASREEREDARPISKDVAHSNAAAIEHPPEDEEDALKRVLKESEQEARLDKVARARVEKDYKRVLELSAQEQVSVADRSEEEEHEDEDESDSTTGWTSSEEEDESEEEEETEQAKQLRAAERIKVLEAAGILVREEGSSSDPPKKAEDKLLRRKTAKKPKPERPERVVPKRREKPHRPERPAPMPPKKDSKLPEEETEDAYDRYVKMTKEVQQRSMVGEETATEKSTVPLAGTQPTSLSPPSSPPPHGTPSQASAGGGLLNTLKNMSRRGAGSPAERKPTPIISGPMAMRSNSPSVGSPTVPSIEDGSSQAQATAGSEHGPTSWSNVIGTQALGEIPEMERKRQEAIFELIRTEGTHVRDLQIVVEVFFNAMQDATFLSDKARTVIFANVEDVLLAAVTLLSDLETRQKDSRLYITRIGDILKDHMRRMNVYLPYCVNQSPARHILMSERSRSAELETLLTDLRTSHPSARGLDLSSFLLVPMQRLTRYPLLISQIARYTDETVDPEEMKDLQSAMTSSQQLLDTTNEAIRARESYDRLESISQNLSLGGQMKMDLTKPTRYVGTRHIIRDEVLFKQKSGRKINVVLCSDLLLLLSSARLYRMPMPLEEVVVRDVPAGLTGRDDLCFQIVHQGREKTNLRCSSARACHTWMHSIDSARADYLSAANKLSRRP